MACKEKNKVLPYLLGELHDQGREPFQDHVEMCEECDEIFKAFEETGKLLRKRTFRKVPARLADNCLRRIRMKSSHQRKSYRFEAMLDRFTLWPQPVWRWALLVVIFFGGLGLGKILFDPPTWFERYDKLTSNNSSLNDLNENRALRNYLLSVETLFLNLSNMDDPSLLDDKEWEMEMEITREVLHRTREVKNHFENRDQELYHLVTEIEWVLEDVIGTAEIDLAELSADVRQTIDARQILTKIHGFIS